MMLFGELYIFGSLGPHFSAHDVCFYDLLCPNINAAYWSYTYNIAHGGNDSDD